MYRVSDVLNPEFARSWHEAVAIVQEVIAQLPEGATVPAVEDLAIDEIGNLQLGFGPDEQQNQVSVLASLLKSLLTGVDAPGGLRDLANDNAKTTPALSSVSTFQRALGFYERPGRASELRGVAARLRDFSAAAVEPKADPKVEFERLREKVAAKAEAEEPTKPAKTRARFSRRTIAIAAAVELAILGAIVVYARPHYFTQTTAFTDRVEQKLADTISSGLNKMGSAEGKSAPAAALPAEAPATGGVEPSKVVKPSLSPAPAGHPVGTALVEKDSARTPILLPTGEVPLTTGGEAKGPVFTIAPSAPVAKSVAAGPHAASASAAPASELFTAANPDVDPPRITRQQLPRQPEPGDDTGYFDVIITETGDVERVQLVSPMRRFQERMLMAAAKAWKFRPALRDGQPVRYRMRIAIILSDKP
jgi:hypothetical protein